MKDYMISMWHAYNLSIRAMLGGPREWTTSAWSRSLALRNNKTAKLLEYVINLMFGSSTHTENALAREDDQFRRAADPNGKYLWLTLPLWLMREAIIVYSVAMLLVSVVHAADTFGPYRADLVRVIDGDTVEVDLLTYPGTRERVSIRENGINTPEKRTRLACEKSAGIRATIAAKQFLYDKQITVERLLRGKYAGRMLGSVYADGVSLAAHMLAEGHARPYDGGKRGPWCAD